MPHISSILFTEELSVQNTYKFNLFVYENF